MLIEASEVAGLVLHFRTPESTAICIRSMVDEGVRRVVLIDNSEDAGVSLAEMHVGLEQLRDAGVTIAVVDKARNLGFSHGVNLGLAQPLVQDAAAVLLINSDARLEPGALACLLGGLGGAGVMIPRVRNTPGAPTVSLFGYYGMASATLARNPGRGRLRFASGCCMLLRRDIVTRPFFDQDFFFYSEDAALGQLLAKRNIVVAEHIGAVILHAGSGSARNGSLFYEYHINRGHWLLAVKLANNRAQMALYSACRCVTLPLRASLRCLRFQSFVPWRGLLAASLDLLRGRVRNFTPPA